LAERRDPAEPADEKKERLEAQFEELRSLLVAEIRPMLMHDRYFSIHELHKEKASRRSVIEHIALDQLSSESAEELGVVLENVDPQTFLQLCTKEKSVSRALQIYIACAPIEKLASVSCMVKLGLKALLKDPFGNYVVQQTCKRDPGTVAILEELVWENFPSLVRDEYASRSMQGLAQLSRSFRSKVFVWFRDHLEEMIECIPAIFLLISAFSSADTPSEFKPFTERVIDPMTRKLITNKNFKRILACFLEHCDQRDLEHVCMIFKLRSKVFTLLDDKYGSLLLVAVLQRGQNAVLKVFLGLLRNDLQQLFQTRFFKSSFFKLAKPPSPAWVSTEMHLALLAMPFELFTKVTAARASRYFYCFLIVVTLRPSARGLEKLFRLYSGLYEQTKLLAVLSDMIEAK
jgi:small basic protein